MNRTVQFSVLEPSTGERLDRYLATAQTDLSRSRLQALIRLGSVRVNGRPERASHRLKAGDEVSVEVPERDRESGLVPEDLPLQIVHEDEELIVVDKPVGMVVHPGAGVVSGTLVHALLHHYPGIASVGGEDRPGIVHRLDKDTSGLMVVAKTARAHRYLVEAIRARQVRRVYTALVWGDVRGESGRIEAAVGRDLRERKRMAVLKRGGRPAATAWTVLERFGVVTLLRVELETGRTHQIRVHLSHVRHPVVGDPTYGGRVKKRLSLDQAERSLAGALLECLPRQALHASELAFQHPTTGRESRFEAPLPQDFSRAVGLLHHDPHPRG